MFKKIKDTPVLRRSVLYVAVILIVSFLYILIFDRNFILRGTSFADYDFFSRQFLRAILNYLRLSIFLGICVGGILFLLYRMFLLIKMIVPMLREKTFPVKAAGLHLLILILIVAGAAGLTVLTSSGMNPYRLLFFTGTGFLVYFLLLYYGKVIRHFETLFLLIALTTGTIFCFGMPQTTNVSWDDQIHYQNVTTLSYLTTCDYSEAEYDLMTLQYPVTFDMDEQSDNLAKLNSDSQSHGLTYEKDYVFLYPNIAYFPAAAVLGICRTLHVPISVVFPLGRLVNLILYSVICFYALKRLKWGKMILGVIALFPTNIFLASNYSYDYWVTSFTFLAFAYLLAELQTPNEKITRKNLCILLGAFLLGFAPKAVYFPLVLLCLLIPAEKFENPAAYKRFRSIVLALCLLIIVSFVIPFLFGGTGGDDTRGGSDVNSMGQVKYVLTHPFSYAKTLLVFLFGDFLTFNTSTEYTNFLAYLGTNSQGTLSMMLLTGAVLLDHRNEDAKILTLRNRVSVYVLSFISIVLVATALYVSFTGVGADTIMGCSPRYLIPVIFPIAYTFGSSRISVNGSRRNIKFLLLGISAYILLHTIYTLSIGLYY